MSTKIKVGSRVMVYQDPYTLVDEEEEATITRVIQSEVDFDCKGNEIFYCKVRFDDEPKSYHRLVSVVL
jgi:hypothetical protein